MNRDEAIKIIANTYPADANCRTTKPSKVETGRQFLEAARAKEWRNESDAVLIEYARLCEEKERIGREHYRDCLRSES